MRLADEMHEGPKWEFLLLIDRIDDTWNGSDIAVVLLTALMHAILEVAASSQTVQPILFLRENLFQRVRQIDSEFSRLETAVVSLDWTQELLIEMIERRLQTAVVTKPPIGETWDCFFDPVDGTSSKEYVLNYCQNRPRDLLIYCNLAIEEAQSHRHTKVTHDDLKVARRKFSLNRLKEVGDEYSENFPRIALVLERFHGLGNAFTIPAISQFIEKLLVDPAILKHCHSWINAYAAPHRFAALLYSIGFLGISNKGVTQYRSHEDSAEAPAIDAQANVVIHPCYVDALNLREAVISSLDALTLQDEGLVLELPEAFTLDDYTARIDELMLEIEDIQPGRADAARWEGFVGEVIRLCFYKSLNNVDAKVRDVAGCTVKDWVAANVAQSGFWHMIKTHPSYRATQVIWECKNYEDLSADDFHQACYYMGGAMGNFCILAFRGDPKHKHYYDHITKIHQGNNKGLVLLLSDADIKVFLRQARNNKTKDSHIQDRFNFTSRAIG
jgi:hypothetical protein